MLDYSDEAKKIVSSFLTYRNDIDVYTEDELKDKEFYKVIFQRLLSDDIKLNDITPLGSKANVIRQCEADTNTKRKKIFIVDGDIVLIHGKDVPTLDNLFVLDAYCIENFLFDKDSIVQFIYLNCASKSKESIETEMSFDQWVDDYAGKLTELFIHFAILHFFTGRFKLSSAHQFHRIIKDQYFFESKLVDEAIEVIKREVLSVISKDQYQGKLDELSKRWDKSFDTLTTIVSGKDYLIPILLIKTRVFKKSNAMPSIDEAKFQLAHFCSLNRLSKLKDKIESLHRADNLPDGANS